MPRIMYWNIENFAIDKLLRYTRKRVYGGRPKYENDIKGQYILDTISSTDQAGAALMPEIFIVVEVSTGRVPGGSLITGAGSAGALFLLNQLQTLNANWRLVPPLVLGTMGSAEGIAVYFRNDLWQFVGPWYWNGANAQAGAGGAAAYGGIWANALPADSNTRAGQPRFTTGGGAAINFPNANNRPPFFTKFQQRGVLVNPQVLSIFSFHAPATFLASMQATATLAQIPEVSAPLGVNEVRVIAGDFNTDLNSHIPAGPAGGAAAGLTPATAFNPLIALGYQNHFAAADGPTMVASIGDADTSGAFPYYGYAQPLSVDNILTWPANPAAPGAVRTQIVNQVVGTPANPAYNTLLARPVGNIYSVKMNETIQDIIGGTAPGGARKRRFTSPVNFGKIGGKRGTSDHLGLVVEF